MICRRVLRDGLTQRLVSPLTPPPVALQAHMIEEPMLRRRPHWWLKQEDDISLTTTVWISPIRIAKETAASGLAPPAILLADNSPDLLSFVAGFFYLTITLNIIYFKQRNYLILSFLYH
jgi:hypothetical protein